MRNLPPSGRLLLLGLDGGEWTLIQRWAKEGLLPTFRRLLVEGASGELRSTAAQFLDTAWPCLYTGLNPGKLDKYFYIQLLPGTLRLSHVTDDAPCAPSFWELLSEAGYRVGVVDAPKFPVSENLHGFQVTNWGAHATRTPRRSAPEALLREVLSRYGPHPVSDCGPMSARRDHVLAQFRPRLLSGVHLRGRLIRDLMRREPWDVFLAVFSETHCAGHHYWHWFDKDHPAHPEKDPLGLADTLLAVYQAIDLEIGAALDQAGSAVTTFVFAAHGMGPLYHATWNLQEVLDLLGYGARPPVAAKSREGRLNPYRMLRVGLPGWLQYRIKSVLPKRLQDYLLFNWYAGNRDWALTRAFAVPNGDSVGAIRINLRGREPDGTVRPDEYDAVCRDLTDAFQELRDPNSGQPVVRLVTKSREVFHGPFLDRLPDLTVLWNTERPWTALESPRIGRLRVLSQDVRTGGHTPRGFVIVKGEGVPSGAEWIGHSILDLAPTFLVAAGVEPSRSMDGRPLPFCSS
jgi:predicted AlkP superfamily phosphohydrolase/phosphomutase